MSGEFFSATFGNGFVTTSAPLTVGTHTIYRALEMQRDPTTIAIQRE